jgi:uncharacterized DUF497 family protein
MVKRFDLSKVIGFEWDKGNKEKNKIKHNVEISESEEVFFNDPIFAYDKVHSQGEDRFLAYGITDNNRLLIISFTIRGEKKNKIRIISSRDQHKKEREYYNKQLVERKKKYESNKK